MIRHYIKRATALVSLLLLMGVGVGLVVLQMRGGKLLSIQSGSMEPMMSKGDMVAVTRTSMSQLAPGDIVTLTNPANTKQTITHRVVELRQAGVGAEAMVVTKGDANIAHDVPVPERALVGQVHGHVPYAGFGLGFVRQPLGLLLLIYVPALAVIGVEIKRLAAYYKSREPYMVPGRHVPTKRRWSLGGRTAALVIAFVGMTAFQSAQAALLGVASLTGNTLASVPVPEQTIGDVTIRRAFIACPVNGSAEVRLRLFTASRLGLPIGDWYVESTGVRVLTVPTGTTLSRTHAYVTETTVAGLSPTSGPVTLHSADGQVVATADWRPVGPRGCLRDF